MTDISLQMDTLSFFCLNLYLMNHLCDQNSFLKTKFQKQKLFNFLLYTFPYKNPTQQLRQESDKKLEKIIRATTDIPGETYL